MTQLEHSRRWYKTNRMFKIKTHHSLLKDEALTALFKDPFRTAQ
jgi:hypothetical protein